LGTPAWSPVVMTRTNKFNSQLLWILFSWVPWDSECKRRLFLKQHKPNDLGRAIAKAVSRWVLPQWPGFPPGSVHVGFVVDNVALWQIFLRVPRFPLSVSPHRGSPHSYITWGMDKGPASGCSSETSSHPIDTNNWSLRIFWNVAPCSHVEVDRRFRGTYCLHHQGDRSTHLWNVGQLQRDYTALHPKRL
jgi:hypothetical protein